MRVWTRVWRAVCRADLYAVRALRVTSERMEGGERGQGQSRREGRKREREAVREAGWEAMNEGESRRRRRKRGWLSGRDQSRGEGG